MNAADGTDDTGGDVVELLAAADLIQCLDGISWTGCGLIQSTTGIVLGFGAKDVLVEHSTDAATWKALGEFEFAQAPATPYASDISVDFGGTVAKYVKLTIKSNWGGILPQYGLSEVRFLYIPIWAREPNPASRAKPPWTAAAA
jgi:hypothetical protein